MPLVIVPTPLGNLGDVTLRALEALRACDLVLAEDSRVARRLLTALGIAGKEIRTYHEHNAPSVTGAILARAASETVVLTSDAGTPGISDPGAALVAHARAKAIPVEVLPGPSAAIGVAVLSGFSLRRFCFEGFPPRAAGARRKALARAAASGTTTVWFESPQRIRATLADLAAVDPRARVFLVREYTKLHEQQLLGTPAEVSSALPEPVLGEIAFAVEGRERPPVAIQPIDEAIDAMLAAGMPVPAIAKRLADEGRGERRRLYAHVTDRKRGTGSARSDS